MISPWLVYLNGEKIHAGIAYKKIKLLEHSNSMLIAY